MRLCFHGEEGVRDFWLSGGVEGVYKRQLPQVLLGGRACFPARGATALQALVGPSIFVIRSASGWNNSKRMTGIIELLADSTRE